MTDTQSEIDIKIVWQQRTAETSQKILGYWEKNDIWPISGRSESQLDTIITTAEKNDEVIAVMGGRQDSQFRADMNFMYLHASVAPEYRGQRLPRDLLEATHSFLQDWSKTNPKKRLMGTGYFFESHRYSHRNQPIRPNGAFLSSFTRNGQPVFIRWFDHATY